MAIGLTKGLPVMLRIFEDGIMSQRSIQYAGHSISDAPSNRLPFRHSNIQLPTLHYRNKIAFLITSESVLITHVLDR